MAEKMYTNEEISRAATNIRKNILGIALKIGGCYLSQACSSAELVATLYMRILNLGPSLGNPEAIQFPGVPSPTNMNYQKGSQYNGYNPSNPDESPYGSPIVNSYCHAWSCSPAYFLRRVWKKQ